MTEDIRVDYPHNYPLWEVWAHDVSADVRYWKYVASDIEPSDAYVMKYAAMQFSLSSGDQWGCTAIGYVDVWT